MNENAKRTIILALVLGAIGAAVASGSQNAMDLFYTNESSQLYCLLNGTTSQECRNASSIVYNTTAASTDRIVDGAVKLQVDDQSGNTRLIFDGSELEIKESGGDIHIILQDSGVSQRLLLKPTNSNSSTNLPGYAFQGYPQDGLSHIETGHKVYMVSDGSTIGYWEWTGTEGKIVSNQYMYAQSFLPLITNTYDLGSSNYNWEDLYLEAGGRFGDIDSGNYIMCDASSSGRCYVYVGNTLIQYFQKAGTAIGVTGGAIYASSSGYPVAFRSADFSGKTATIAGGTQFAFTIFGAYPAGAENGSIATFWRGASYHTTDTYNNADARVTTEGAFMSGLGGENTGTIRPEDGKFGSTGWAESWNRTGTTNPSNQPGADVYWASGSGTGNNATKGVHYFTTPEVQGSGTTLQPQKKRWKLNLNGSLEPLEQNGGQFILPDCDAIAAPDDRSFCYNTTSQNLQIRDAGAWVIK